MGSFFKPPFSPGFPEAQGPPSCLDFKDKGPPSRLDFQEKILGLNLINLFLIENMHNHS